MSDWQYSQLKETSQSQSWQPLDQENTSKSLSLDWEVKTAISSQDSGYQQSSHSSSHLWPLTSVDLSLGLESLFPGQVQEDKSTHQAGESQDLLDSLIREDMEERLQMMTVSGSSESSLKVLGNLMRPVGRPITGKGRVTQLDLSHSYTTQISNLSNLVSRDVPLTFPGQMVPVSVKVPPLLHPPAVPSLSYQDLSVPSLTAPLSGGSVKKPQPQSKPQSVKDKSGGKRKEGPRLIPGGVLEEEVAAVSRQLVMLTREREECEDLLADLIGFKQKRASVATPSSAGDGGTPLERLLADVTGEHDRIVCLMENIKMVSGVGQGLLSSLARCQAITRDIYTDIKRSKSQDSLSLHLPQLRTNIRRIRTQLWTIVNSLET